MRYESLNRRFEALKVGGCPVGHVVCTQSAPFTVFTLSETPTPTPGVLTLLALASLVGRCRRR